MKSAGVLLALGVTACGSAELRGATSVARERTPIGEERGRYVARACRDGRGQPALPVPAELRVIELADGRQLLLESRRGYDSILVTNRFEDRGRTIFQFLSESEGGSEVLHERSFERGQASSGELVTADLFETTSVASGFRAATRRVVLRCTLVAAADDLDTTARLE